MGSREGASMPGSPMREGLARQPETPPERRCAVKVPLPSGMRAPCHSGWAEHERCDRAPLG